MFQLFSAPLPPELRSRFLHYGLLRMRTLASVVLTLSTAGFALFALMGVFVTGGSSSPLLRFTIFCGLAALSYGISKARSAAIFAFIGIAFVTLVEIGTVVNASGLTDPLTLALPAIILVPIGAGPIWLTRRSYVIGTACSWLVVLPFILSLSMTHSMWTVLGMYFVLCISLSLMLHVLFLGYRRESFILEIRLADMTSLDALTGVPNRRYFFEKATALLRSCTALGEPANAVFVDIDHFKSLNDSYGHAAGDIALREVAQTLAKFTRERDVLGRMGGEEFAVLITACPVQKAQELAERLRVEVNRLPRPDGFLSVSLGVAQYLPGETLEQLLVRADHAMLRAKRAGRNRVEMDGEGV